MIIKISENLIVNIDHISHVYGNELFLIDGSKFKLDEISMRNVNKVAKQIEDRLFKTNDFIESRMKKVFGDNYDL